MKLLVALTVLLAVCSAEEKKEVAAAAPEPVATLLAAHPYAYHGYNALGYSHLGYGHFGHAAYPYAAYPYSAYGHHAPVVYTALKANCKNGFGHPVVCLEEGEAERRKRDTEEEKAPAAAEEESKIITVPSVYPYAALGYNHLPYAGYPAHHFPAVAYAHHLPTTAAKVEVKTAVEPVPEENEDKPAVEVKALPAFPYAYNLGAYHGYYPYSHPYLF